jgi:hypothetical protein
LTGQQDVRLSSEASREREMIMAMLQPNPTQERFRLAAYYLTDLTF